MPDEEVQAKPKATRTSNAELAAMAQIDRRLSEELPTDDSRARVVQWLTSYYGPTLADRIEAGR